MKSSSSPAGSSPVDLSGIDHMRFHRHHEHLVTTFGNDRFALKAEAFARFFGTPVFLGVQTVITREPRT